MIILILGILLLLLGILFFTINSLRIKRIVFKKGMDLNGEAAGIILFISGTTLVIAFLIMKLEPGFLSKGLG